MPPHIASGDEHMFVLYVGEASEVHSLGTDCTSIAHALVGPGHNYARCRNINPGSDGPTADVGLFLYACVMARPVL